MRHERQPLPRRVEYRFFGAIIYLPSDIIAATERFYQKWRGRPRLPRIRRESRQALCHIYFAIPLAS